MENLVYRNNHPKVFQILWGDHYDLFSRCHLCRFLCDACKLVFDRVVYPNDYLSGNLVVHCLWWYLRHLVGRRIVSLEAIFELDLDCLRIYLLIRNLVVDEFGCSTAYLVKENYLAMMAYFAGQIFYIQF